MPEHGDRPDDRDAEDPWHPADPSRVGWPAWARNPEGIVWFLVTLFGLAVGILAAIAGLAGGR